MVQVRQPTLERDGFGVRELVMLLAAMAVVGMTLGFILVRGREEYPTGTIGYWAGGDEAWVNARGETMDVPQGWPQSPIVAPPLGPPLGVAQFPSPDGWAIAVVRTTDEGSSLVSRLMVEEAGRIAEVGQLGNGSSPPLVLSSKGGARSRDGVPLIVRWSPDGQRLAWGSVIDPPYTLHVAKRGEWETGSMPLEGGYVGELTWSPDGRYLAISTYAKDRLDHTLLVLDTLEHGEPRRIAKGCVVVWSPDSQHLVLHGEPRTQPGLLVVSVDGKVRRVSERTDVAPFAWVPE